MLLGIEGRSRAGRRSLSFVFNKSLSLAFFLAGFAHPYRKIQAIWFLAFLVGYQADRFGACTCFFSIFLGDVSFLSRRCLLANLLRWDVTDLHLGFDLSAPSPYLQFGGPLCGPGKSIFGLVHGGACVSCRKAPPESAGGVRRRFGVIKICCADGVVFLEVRSCRFEAGDAISLVATSSPSRRRRGHGWSAVATRGAQAATQRFVQVLERVVVLSRSIQCSAQRVRARAH